MSACNDPVIRLIQASTLVLQDQAHVFGFRERCVRDLLATVIWCLGKLNARLCAPLFDCSAIQTTIDRRAAS